jgi:AraC-like DNA-binding protein
MTIQALLRASGPIGALPSLTALRAVAGAIPDIGRKPSDDGLPVPALRQDAVLVVVYVRDSRSYCLWIDGRLIPVDLISGPARDFASSGDRFAPREDFQQQWFHFYVARNSEAASRDCAGNKAGNSPPYPPCMRISDEIVHHLGECLIKASAAKGDKRLLECLLLSLHAHMARSYANASIAARARGGLALWQVQRAQQIMRDNLEGSISIPALAAACRLSASHFARSFKLTVGLSPHRWLMSYRVECAKHLLAESNQPLADIALACGFTDQSHLARVFSQLAGATPGAWRRTVKSSADVDRGYAL